MKREYKKKESFIKSLYMEMYPPMYSYAYVRLKDSKLAKEVVQNVFVIALKKYDTLRNSANPKELLMVILRYLLNNRENDQSNISNKDDHQELIEKIEKLDVT